MEKRVPLPKPAVPKGLVLVGKGPPLIKAKDAGAGGPPGGPPGAKLALHGKGPPPGKTAPPKQGPPLGAAGGEAVSKPPLPGAPPSGPLSKGGPSSPPEPSVGNTVKTPAVLPKPPLAKPPLPGQKAAPPAAPQAPSAAKGSPEGSPPAPLSTKPPLGPPASLPKKPTASIPSKSAAATPAAKPTASPPAPPLASKDAKALPGPPASKTGQQTVSGNAATPAAAEAPKPPGGGLTPPSGKQTPPAAPKPGAGPPGGQAAVQAPTPPVKPAGADGKTIPPKGGPPLGVKGGSPPPTGAAGGAEGGLKPPVSSPLQTKSETPSAPGSIRMTPPSGKDAGPRPEEASSLDEFGRQRGSVGDLAPRSELAHDLLGRSIPVFDKAGNFVAYASGPPPALSRIDPSTRVAVAVAAAAAAAAATAAAAAAAVSRVLADRKPQVRDSMKGHGERGAGGFDPGLMGGVNVPGGIPGFFMAVPPWPAPTPMPIDQLAGWGGSPPTAFGYPPPQPYVSPYAAFPPQPVGGYPPGCLDGSQAMHAPPNYGGVQQLAQQPPPLEETRLRASEKKVRGEPKSTRRSSGQPADAAASVKGGKESRRRSSALPQFESGRARGYVMSRGDEEVGNSRWSAVERHLNNIRGGYGEASRPPEEADNPPRTPSARARHRSSGARDEVYSGFRPYYIRDKKPYVEEVIPRHFVSFSRSGDPLEASGGKPVLPRRSNLIARPKDRTWDRWGTTGLTAPRRRAYQSLSELASCFSNLEPQDQDDVISLLLLCRNVVAAAPARVAAVFLALLLMFCSTSALLLSAVAATVVHVDAVLLPDGVFSSPMSMLEQRVEKQHVVIDMLEHDLSEAQKILKFPPEWRSLENVDLAGMVPSDTPFQATAATPLYVKSATYLPANVPEEPGANFGVGVKTSGPTTGQAPPSQASPAAKAKVASPAPATAAPAAEGPKKLPAGMKPKAPLLGVKKPTFKKM
ncbi:hypothetical protein Emag_006198 [Eimeria magna]